MFIITCTMVKVRQKHVLEEVPETPILEDIQTKVKEHGFDVLFAVCVELQDLQNVSPVRACIRGPPVPTVGNNLCSLPSLGREPLFLSGRTPLFVLMQVSHSVTVLDPVKFLYLEQFFRVIPCCCDLLPLKKT